MSNRLARETSPYLKQHADNPVDWYAWGPAALEQARAEDKPILLSIGYSACHWCHVMAHESFEDPATAEVMNRLYVNIKVDREERPDLDHLYQVTHQLLSRRGGGWPLTVLMTPDQVPFFSGTYLPPTPRYGLPALRDLLTRAEQIYRSRPQEIAQQAAVLREALARIEPSVDPGAPTEAWDRSPIDGAVDVLRAQFDAEHGGFGHAPKFPQPHLLAFFLRHAPEEVLFTLRKMAEGGIYDHLGGGFCRYSVDAEWTIPHFEKMLYDNGLLLALYADAYALSAQPLFAQVVEQTIVWALREMRSLDGGFYAALDADSEGEEGKAYVWTRAEIASLLTADERTVVMRHYGLEGPPNFEGQWHLRVTQRLDAVAQALGRSSEETTQLLASARRKLFTARSRRVPPGLDDKVLTSWNALMIRGVARAARVFDRADWLAVAQDAVDFLRHNVWRGGRLFATFQAGHARHVAYLDDHAFLLDALLELMQTRFRAVDFEFAVQLAQALLERFEDRANGGFFFTSHDHEQLLHRAKPVEDHAIPAGNAVAAYALQRLSHLSGEAAYGAVAQRALYLFQGLLRQAPQHVPSLLGALEEYLDPPQLVVLRGRLEQLLLPWQRALAQRFLPHTMVVAVGDETQAHFTLPPTLAKPAGDAPCAYVCLGTSCLPPVTSLEALWPLLRGAPER